MKLVRAIIRPEKEEQVIKALEGAGLVSLTKMDVLGRGQQRGIQVGATIYDELPKLLLMLVVEDRQVETAIRVIEEAARAGRPGDGKIFISPVDSAYTIRTGERVVEPASPST